MSLCEEDDAVEKTKSRRSKFILLAISSKASHVSTRVLRACPHPYTTFQDTDWIFRPQKRRRAVTVNRCPVERQINGRRYCNASYIFPCDDFEYRRLSNLDLVLAREAGAKEYLDSVDGVQSRRYQGGELHRCELPYERRIRVLDLACGNGDYAENMACTHPGWLVVGADTSPMAVHLRAGRNIPLNLSFRTPIDFGDQQFWKNETTYHLIHARQCCGTVRNWPALIKRVFNQLEPGGHFELEEIDFRPQCDDGTLSPRGAVTLWWRGLSQATEGLGLPLALNAAVLEELLIKAGFEDIGVESTRLAIGTDSRRRNKYYESAQVDLSPKDCSECTFWPLDEKERALGDLYLNAMADDNCNSLDGLSNAAFFALPFCLPESWHTFKAKVRDEMQNTSVHIYNTLYKFSARKPTKGKNHQAQGITTERRMVSDCAAAGKFNSGRICSCYEAMDTACSKSGGAHEV